MYPRHRRPYERKTASKGGAIFFGLGVIALLGTAAVVVALGVPGISRRLENLPYYARTYYNKLVPHPEYLPTPAPTVAVSQASLPTLLPTPTAPPPPTATPAAQEALPQVELAASSVVALESVADQVQLPGIGHQWQTWNNCGPATVTMNTSFFGRPETQVEAARFLKPNKDDKNVSPHELAAYARTTGLEATVRQGGSIEQLKLFLSNNLPVLAETWLVHDGDGLGHYRLLTGFDDAAGQFTTFDSLNGPGFKVSYEQFDADWRVFNRLYLVIYPPEQAATVLAIIGQDIDDSAMYQKLVAQAQAELETDPNDAIAYFNQGEALTRLGRHEEAVQAFDQARRLGLHWRRLWYQFTPFEAYYATGRYQDVLDLTEATLDGTGGLEEAYYYQGLARQASGQSGAAESFEAALDYNPNFGPAQDALSALPIGP